MASGKVSEARWGLRPEDGLLIHLYNEEEKFSMEVWDTLVVSQS